MPKLDRMILTDVQFKPHYEHWNTLRNDFPSGFNFRQISGKPEHGAKRNSFSFLMPEVQSKKLCLLSKNHDNGLYVVLLTAVGILMQKYSGSKAIVVDSPLHKEVPNDLVTGDCVPLCFKIDKDENFKTNVLHVQQSARNCFRHQNYPREFVNESINNINFCTNILFSFDSIHLKINSSHHDLVFNLSESYGSYELVINYNPIYFEKHFIKQIPNHLINLIDQVDEEHITVGNLSIISESEINNMLTAWNETAVEFLNEFTIAELFEKQVKKYPDHIALIVNNNSYTYSHLNKTANKLAHHLQDEYKIRQGDFVGLMLEKSEFIIFGILGILKAGGVYIPIDPKTPKERINFIFEDTKLKLLFTQMDYFYHLGGFKGQLFMLDMQLDDLSTPTTDLCKSCNVAEPAYMIYTSGSTGKPKGVLVNHLGVANLASWQASQFNVKPGKSILQFFSYSFDGAVGETFMALLNGATLVMYNSHKLNIQDLTDFLNRYYITVGVFVPSLLKQLDPERVCNGKTLCIVSVGEKCPVELAKKWMKYCQFVNAYGPTEYTVYSHLAEINTLHDRATVPIGKPIHNTKSYILDDALNPVPVSVVGELYISGAGMAEGYWNRKDLTMDRFIPNPFFLNSKFTNNGLLKVGSATSEITHFKQRRNSRTLVENFEKDYTTVESIMPLLEELDPDLKSNSKNYLNDCIGEQEKFRSFRRYLLEGYYNTYASTGINAEVILKLLPHQKFKGSKGIDLGFGNCEAMKEIASLGAEISGIELSPFAVQKARNQGFKASMGKVDMCSEDFLEHFDLNQGCMDFVISILLLDRVQKPLNLLKNMFFLLRENGSFMLQTLLPVCPIDDGDIDQKITYTFPNDMITEGRSVATDKLRIMQLLYTMGAKDLMVCEVPIAVSSRDGIQSYVVYSFQGYKGECPGFEEVGYALLYKTGDSACYSHDGKIDFKGRVDNQVKLRGFRIELEEIERNILTHKDINEAVVVLNEEQSGNPILAAYYVENSPVKTDEIKNYLRVKLPDYMIPSHFMRLPAIPLNINGKLDRNSLPAISGTSKNIKPPENETERELFNLWKQALNKSDFGTDANFFEVGGHSLKATQLCYLINKNLHVKLDLSKIFENPTISLQANLVTSLGRSDFEPIPRISESKLYVTSHSQQRIWLAVQMGADPALFNMPMAYKFKGQLDVKALETAFLKITERYEILRTVFAANPEGLSQVILPMIKQKFKLQLDDTINEKDKDIKVKKLIQQMMAPFNLSEGPLFRCAIIKLKKNQHLLFLNFHHIISDGWAINIFVDEIHSIYRGIKKNVSIDLPALPIQYKDFSHWQNDKIQHDKLIECKDYWIAKLRGLNPLSLLTDYPRSQKKSHAGKVYSVEFGNDLYADVFGFIRNRHSSFFNVMVGFVKILLFRYTGQSDIIVGTPVSGRNHADLENQLGIFLNLLPLATSLDNEMSIADAINSVKKTIFEAYKYQEYPFDLIKTDLEIETDESNSPIFNALVQVFEEDKDVSGKGLPGITSEKFELPATLSKYDLSFFFYDFDHQIKIEVEYSTELFKESTIDRFCRDLRKIMAAALSDQHLRIDKINLMEDEASLEETKSFMQSMFDV